MDQQSALNKLLKSKSNVFLTGEAGSGKTYLTKKFVEQTNCKVTASTGVAATLLGGRTAHSFFGLGTGVGPDVVKDAVNNRFVSRRLRATDAVVIDEISMIGSKTLGLIDMICQKIRGNHKAFGGIRIIGVGDFNQLCPIQEDWAFTAKQWGSFRPIYLTEQFRSADADLIECLRDIREGTVYEETAKFLNNRVIPAPEHCIRLFTHNKNVEKFNNARLAALPGPETVFETKYKWHEKRGNYYEHQRNFPISPIIRIRVGAQVMLRKNDLSAKAATNYVNGDLAVVKDVSETNITVTRVSDNRDIYLPITEFTIKDPDDGADILSAYNFPLSLSWATSIHKAQGQSINAPYEVDLRTCFAPGQFYVALSRAVCTNHLHIKGWRTSSVIIDKKVTKFYEKIKTTS